MAPNTMLEMIFPSQDKYREITQVILNLFIGKSQQIEGRSELELNSVVTTLRDRGYNRHTVYKVMREYLVPLGIINWKKFEGSIQLSTKFGNSLRRFSLSWNNLISRIEKGKQPQIG
jgi:beta-glucosidase/6-phospho-beta-glucosidase/beta-galactosidase